MADTDGYQLVSAGMARLVIGGVEHMLRAPKIGELKRLRVLQQQHNDEDTRQAHEAQGITNVLNLRWQAREAQLQQVIDGDDPVAAAEAILTLQGELATLRQEMREAKRALDVPMEDRRTRWLRTAIEMLDLSKSALPDDDDWPAWSLDAQVAIELLNHWTTSPSGSGAS